MNRVETIAEGVTLYLGDCSKASKTKGHAMICDCCGKPNANPENAYGEIVCDSCLDNLAEAAWQRHCEALYGGSGPLPLIEQQRRAFKLKCP